MGLLKESLADVVALVLGWRTYDREGLGASLYKCAEQISCWKQCEANNSAPQIDVMTDTMRDSPIHPREQLKRFANMGKRDHYKSRCAN